jgi:hypothetical protein
VQLITSGPSDVSKRQSTVQTLGRGAGLLVLTITVLWSGETVQLKAAAGTAGPIIIKASVMRCSTFRPPSIVRPISTLSPCFCQGFAALHATNP